MPLIDYAGNRFKIKPVKAPECTCIHGRIPLWNMAFKDRGGTIFGPGPYLKLYYSGGDMGDDEVMVRVRANSLPGWKVVDVVQESYGGWYWVFEREACNSLPELPKD